MSTRTMVDAAFAELDVLPLDSHTTIETADQLAGPLNAALMVFAIELENSAEAIRTANKRGAKGKSTILDEAAAIIRGRAAELETHGPISEAERKRAEALAATERARRRDAGARPNADDIAALNAFVAEKAQVNGSQAESTALQVDTPGDAAAFIRGETDELDLTTSNPLGLSGEQQLAPLPDDGLADAAVINDDPFRTPYAEAPSDDPFAVAGEGNGRPAWRLDPAPVPFAFDPTTALPVPGHVSYSQITTAAKCGLQLRIKKRDGVKGQPGYATTGGKTFHACVELIERRRLGLLSHGAVDAVMAGDLAACAELFVRNFDLEIAAAVRESGVPVQRWKVAAKGAEDDAWWRHNGALMVRDYVAWAADRHAEGWAIYHVPGKMLGIELELNTPVGRDIEADVPVNLNAILDQVWFKWEQPVASPGGQVGMPVLHLHIEDGKSGAKPVTDTFQLGLYAHVLKRVVEAEFPPMVVENARITGSYYDARNGKSGDVLDPLSLHSWQEIEYRALTTLAQHAAGIYPANPETAWGGPCNMCDVRHACPIMAMRD